MLLFKGGPRGLGLNPAVTQAANTTHSAGAESSHAGGFSITEHTWTEAYYAFFFGSNYREIMQIRSGTPDEQQAKWAVHIGDLNARIAAAGYALPGCPVGAITDNGGSCYFDRLQPFVVGDGFQIGLLPPLVFAVFNTPFTIGELTGDRFARNTTPTRMQRLLMEGAIIRRSQNRFLGRDGYDNPNQRTVFGDAELYRAIINYNNFHKYTPFPTDPSVEAVLSLVPDMMLFSINFEMNSIQPTPAERTQSGGWRSWITRGGYPLSRVVVTGKAPCNDAMGIAFCKSLLCQCPSAMPHPSCLGESADTLVGKTGTGFYPYVSIPQDAVRSEVQLSLVFDEASTLKKFAEAARKVLTALAGVMCSNQGVTQSVVAAGANQEKCADKATGKPCTKGQPGCICNKPPIEGQIGAGVFNGAMTLWCTGWQSENLPDPIDSLPVVDPPPMAEPSRPWWLIAGAGLLVGAGAFAFLGPSKPT